MHVVLHDFRAFKTLGGPESGELAPILSALLQIYIPKTTIVMEASSVLKEEENSVLPSENAVEGIVAPKDESM